MEFLVISGYACLHLKKKKRLLCVCGENKWINAESCCPTLKPIIFITFFHLVLRAAMKRSFCSPTTVEKCQSRIKGTEVRSAQHSIPFEERIIKSPAITRRSNVGMSMVHVKSFWPLNWLLRDYSILVLQVNRVSVLVSGQQGPTDC